MHWRRKRSTAQTAASALSLALKGIYVEGFLPLQGFPSLGVHLQMLSRYESTAEDWVATQASLRGYGEGGVAGFSLTPRVC